MSQDEPLTSENVLGERLKELREQRGLTQAQLATRAKVERSTIQNVESGRVRRPNTLPHIADALGVTEAELLGEEPAKNAAELEEIIQDLAAVLERFRRWRREGD